MYSRTNTGADDSHSVAARTVGSLGTADPRAAESISDPGSVASGSARAPSTARPTRSALSRAGRSALTADPRARRRPRQRRAVGAGDPVGWALREAYKDAERRKAGYLPGGLGNLQISAEEQRRRGDPARRLLDAEYQRIFAKQDTAETRGAVTHHAAAPARPAAGKAATVFASVAGFLGFGPRAAGAAPTKESSVSRDMP